MQDGVLSPLGVLMTSPLGRVSLKLTPLNEELLFGLAIWNVNVEVLPCEIELGEKLLDSVGGLGF